MPWLLVPFLILEAHDGGQSVPPILPVSSASSAAIAALCLTPSPSSPTFKGSCDYMGPQFRIMSYRKVPNLKSISKGPLATKCNTFIFRFQRLGHGHLWGTLSTPKADQKAQVLWVAGLGWKSEAWTPPPA